MITRTVMFLEHRIHENQKFNERLALRDHRLKIYSILFENKLRTIDVIPVKGQQSLQSGSLMDFF